MKNSSHSSITKKKKNQKQVSKQKQEYASNLFLFVAQCLFCFLVLSTKKGRKVKNTTGERNSLFFVHQFHWININIFLFGGQHPAGTSDMKSNSFWPSQSSGSSLARSKPSSTTSDIRTSSSTGSKSIIPPAPAPWFPMLIPTPIPPPPRPPDGPRSWFPVPRGEVPKPLWAPPGAGCPAEAPARFW